MSSVLVVFLEHFVTTTFCFLYTCGGTLPLSASLLVHFALEGSHSAVYSRHSKIHFLDIMLTTWTNFPIDTRLQFPVVCTLLNQHQCYLISQDHFSLWVPKIKPGSILVSNGLSVLGDLKIPQACFPDEVARILNIYVLIFTIDFFLLYRRNNFKVMCIPSVKLVGGGEGLDIFYIVTQHIQMWATLAPVANWYPFGNFLVYFEHWWTYSIQTCWHALAKIKWNVYYWIWVFFL